MFTEILLTGPTLRFSKPGDARAWLHATFPFLPRIVFNRDEDGRNVSAIAHFTTHPIPSGVALEAFGRMAVEILLGLVGEITKTFVLAVPAGSMTTRSGTSEIKVGDSISDFVVCDLVIENSASRRNIFRDTRATPGAIDLTAISERVFREALERRLYALGLELDEDVLMGEFEAAEIRPCYAGKKPFMTVDLRFRSNGVFCGPWYVGRFANKGCGRIRRYIAGATATKTSQESESAE